ncbi:hypothetical protein ACFQ3S_04355 [Mucilaginibacter terrae]|uniref:hypothetical protein n=1 Tax=Mucilaginibacter terrae TaxID=1955052 RepID=UPI00363699EC
MKKILFIAALLFSTGMISSCTKDNVSPTTETVAGNPDDDGESGGGLGTGDGGIDRPVKKP